MSSFSTAAEVSLRTETSKEEREEGGQREAEVQGER